MRSNLLFAPLVAALLALGGCGEDAPLGAAASSESAPAVATGDPAPANAAETPADAAAAAPAAFAQCRSCHLVEPGKHTVGPSLAGVFGKPAASAEGFAYSAALKEAGITWDRASLDRWLAGPMQIVPGTRMVLPVRDEAQRKAIIDYLETLQ